MRGMRVCVLASGSKGNATYVEGGGTRVLIDAGLSCRALEQRLGAAGIEAEGLDGILVTHEPEIAACASRQLLMCDGLITRDEGKGVVMDVV